MRISVKVRPNAKKDSIEKISADTFSVSVKAKPQDGKANHAVRVALADYFGVPKSQVVMLKGEKSRNKIFNIIG